MALFTKMCNLDKAEQLVLIQRPFRSVRQFQQKQLISQSNAQNRKKALKYFIVFSFSELFRYYFMLMTRESRLFFFQFLGNFYNPKKDKIVPINTISGKNIKKFEYFV